MDTKLLKQLSVITAEEREILTGMNGAPYCSVSMSQLAAETTIDLANAEEATAFIQSLEEGVYVLNIEAWKIW